MLGMFGGGENICDWLFMMKLLPLRYHCTRKLQSLSQSEEDAAAGTQTAEPFVILTACLFSFVAGEHEIQSSGTCYHLNCHC